MVNYKQQLKSLIMFSYTVKNDLTGPSRTIIIDPIENPIPQPREIPQEEPVVEPERERETTPQEEPVPA